MAQAKILQLVCEVLNFKLTFYQVTKLNQNVLNKYRLEKGPMQNMQIPHIQAQVKPSTIFLVWGNVADHCTTLLLDNQKKVNGWIVKSSGFWDYWISAQVLIRSFQFAILCFGLWFHCCVILKSFTEFMKLWLPVYVTSSVWEFMVFMHLHFLYLSLLFAWF